MTIATPRPFPWDSLESVTREEVAALRAMRGWGARNAREETLSRVLGELLETRVEILLRRAGRAAGAPALDDGAAVVLARVGATELRRGVLVEVEGSLATTLASRAMRRTAPAITEVSRPATAALAGAIAAIAAAASRRCAGPDGALRVLAAGPSPALVADFLRADPDILVASFTMLVGDEAFLARAYVPRIFAEIAPPAPWSAEALRSLGDVLLSVPIVAAATPASVGDIASLRIGDVWLPGAWRLARSVSGALFGPVLLAAPSLEHGTHAELCEDGRLVLGGKGKGQLWPGEARMTGTNGEAEALVEAVGEVPIVVRVEIGAAEMRAREWAALRNGDIIALGRRIAEPVVLRVGGVEVARGELVEIEGEIGVRVLGRSDNENETPS